VNLQIFYSKDQDIMPAIKNALEKTYEGLRVADIDEMRLAEDAYNPERCQYRADTLSEELIQNKSEILGSGWCIRTCTPEI